MNHTNKSVVRFTGTDGTKMIIWKNGRVTKECCMDCKFDNFHEYFNEPKDPCSPCDAHGSMKQILTGLG